MNAKNVFSNPIFRHSMLGAGLGGGLGYALSGEDKVKGTLAGAALGGLMGAGVGSKASDRANTRKSSQSGYDPFEEYFKNFHQNRGQSKYQYRNYNPRGPSFKDHLNRMGFSGVETTKAEAKRKFREQAMKHHPDRGGSDAKMQEINNSWDEIKKSPWFKKLAFPSFWLGFEKKAAEAIDTATEIAGLGTLAVPSIKALRGRPMSDHGSHKMELAGLGILAAPSVYRAGKWGWNKLRGNRPPQAGNA